MTNGSLHIGTSNGQMPGNKSSFPPEYQLKSRLHFYSTHLNSIEVNSCFYKTPQVSTYEKWARDVPDDFQFTLKLTRDATHVKDLVGDLACIEQFLKSATGTGNKKGCLLIQFPGKITIEHFNQVETILDNLRIYDPLGEWKKAIEFRNPSWYIAETNELLDTYDATMVLHDFPKAKISGTTTKANFIYMRFHGPTGNYRESYGASFLDNQSIQVKEYLEEGKDVYVYFNNTAGSAFENAIYLRDKLGDALPHLAFGRKGR